MHGEKFYQLHTQTITAVASLDTHAHLIMLKQTYSHLLN